MTEVILQEAEQLKNLEKSRKNQEKSRKIKKNHKKSFSHVFYMGSFAAKNGESRENLPSGPIITNLGLYLIFQANLVDI